MASKMNTAKSREERLAEQLRTNLRRRKVQARAQAQTLSDRADKPEEPPLPNPPSGS